MRLTPGRWIYGLAVPLALAATGAWAQQGSLRGNSGTRERLASPRTPCAAVAAAVTSRGAVVLDTGPGTFERVVRDAGLCALEETTRPAFEPTADDPRCFVGYRCVDRLNEGRRDD